MKRQTAYKLTVIAAILIYAISFVATSKQLPLDPCYEKMVFWLEKDTSLSNHANINLFNDSVVVFADSSYAINWSNVSDSLCSILKRECNKTSASVLVINAKDTVQSHWDTRYGRKILYKNCP